MKYNKVDSILDKLEAQGWTIKKKKRHYMACPPDDDQTVVTISVTPSDHRAFKNIVSDCRKRGADL